MKVKFGDLTVRQMKAICDMHSNCGVCCPLYGSCDNQPWMQNLNREIDLPDEEEEEKCRTKRSSS